jgi:hypothetical protein
MAAWLSALKVLPWREALLAAPTIVRGARDLWASVRRTDTKPPVQAESTATPEQVEDLARIRSRLTALESRIQEMADEALASAELVKSLAEQNSRLVEAVEILRLRTRILLGSTAALVVVAASLAAMMAFAR